MTKLEWERFRTSPITDKVDYHDTMDGPLKELEKLRTSTESSTKGKIPSAESSLDSLLQSLYEVKSRIEAGTVTQDTFALLSQTVDAKKKEIDDKQKEVYNAIARLGKALDKVCLGYRHPRNARVQPFSRDSRSLYPLIAPSLHRMLPKKHSIERLPCTSFVLVSSPQQRPSSKYVDYTLLH